MLDGTEQVEKDELIYRRVLDKTGFYKPDRPHPLSPKAFRPVPRDIDGISVTRANYVGRDPLAAAALGEAGRNYYIIEIRAGDLEAIGLTVQPSPIPPDDLGHAVIPLLNIANVHEPKSFELMDKIVTLIFKPYGPFPGNRPRKTM